MSLSSTDDRIKSLFATADEAQRTHNFAQAFQALKEASQLQPQNEEVRDRWKALQSSSGSLDILQLLRNYVSSGEDEDGQKAVQALKQKQLAANGNDAVLDLLYRGGALTSAKSDALTATVLGTQIAVRRRIAERLVSNASEIFEEMFERGDESFRAFASIPFESSLWSSKDAQNLSQKDLFRLCVAKLMDAGVEHPERAMRAIARELAAAPENVTGLADDDVFDVVLASLDIRGDAALRSQALLAVSKMFEATKETGERLFTAFITGKVARQTNDDLIVAFSAAAAVFPIVPAVASKLFMTDGFVQELVPNLERNSEAAAAGGRKSRTLEQAAMELLSAACVDKACREAINRYCLHWLQDLSNERDGVHKALASLILAKISEQSVDDVNAKLSDLVLHGDRESDQAVEGLAYTSLQPRIKEEVAGKDMLMRQLMASLKDRPNVTFGCLTIFVNLSSYRPTQSEEQKRMSQLKAYANANANSSRAVPEDPLDDDKHVTVRCKKLLDCDVVPALVVCTKQTTSPTCIALVVRILLAVSWEQKHRAKMAQQGAVKLLLQIRDRIAKTDKSTGEAAIIERGAAHALGRLLISVNPVHVFSATLPTSSAVSALLPLLSYDQDKEERDLLPTFECLLALTNLASMDDPTARDVIIRSAWTKIEDLLFSANTSVQRASVELVCNMMASPVCVAKFADGSKDAKRRLQILLALADVEDLATRRAAGGALATLTEWDAAVSALLNAKEKNGGVKTVLGMCKDESEEMKHRGFVCLMNVITAPNETGKRGAEAVKMEGGADVVKEVLRETRNPDILGLGVEILNKLG